MKNSDTAFPCNSPDGVESYKGMTLRDYFVTHNMPEPLKMSWNMYKDCLAKLEGRQFLTISEFATLARVTKSTVYGWGKKNYLRLKKYSPKRTMIPASEVLRYLRGEMLEDRQ